MWHGGESCRVFQQIYSRSKFTLRPPNILNETSMLSLRLREIINGGRSLLLVTAQDTIMSTKFWIFIRNNTHWSHRVSQCLFCNFTIWSWLKIFFWWKMKHILLKRRLSCSKALQSCLFSLRDKRYNLWKNDPFVFCMRDNVIMHYMPDKKLRHSHSIRYGPYRLDRIIANRGLDIIWKFVFFSYQNN